MNEGDMLILLRLTTLFFLPWGRAARVLGVALLSFLLLTLFGVPSD